MKVKALLAAFGLGAALAVPVVSAGQASAAPLFCLASDAAIYTPPARVTGNPGDLLACRPTTLPVIPNAPAMKAWKVQYVSVNVKGAKIAVSGTVAIPTAAWTKGGARPTVAYHPFTHGSANMCALSKQLSGAPHDAFEAPNLSGFLGDGYALAMTDGVGYLDGETHTYMNGPNSGHATLDVVRAARQIPRAGFPADGKIALHGYSEGGGGSMWAAQLAASYAPELNVVGVASGGIPADLRAATYHLNGSAFAGFLADAVIGLNAAYPEMPFDELLNDTGRQAVKDTKSQCLVGTLALFAGKRLEMFTNDKLTVDQLLAVAGPGGVTWGDVVDTHKLGVDVGTPSSGAKYKVGFPVFQYRGFFEEALPTSATDKLRADYCKAGINTTWNASYPTEHGTTLYGAAGDVRNFIRDRFDGKPTTGNC